MKKVVAVSGSPRKTGNTSVLLRQVLRGAESMGAETELVILADLAIADCIGCHACWRGKDCPFGDDMNDLYPILSACDALIFGTPVYWYGPTAVMKAFLDRFVYFNSPDHRALIQGKPVALVSPFEENNTMAVQPLLDMFRHSFSYLEVIQSGELIAPGVTKAGEVAEDEAMMEKAFGLGKALVQ